MPRDNCDDDDKRGLEVCERMRSVEISTLCF